MINKKVKNPLKATTLGLFILFTYLLHTSRIDSHKEALNLLSTYHNNVMSSLDSNISEITSGLSYDDILSDVLIVLNSFDSETSAVPNLLTSFTDDLVGSMKEKIDSRVNSVLSSFKERGSSKSVKPSVEEYVDQIMGTLDIKFKTLVDDDDELSDYYSDMISVMRPRFVNEISEVIVSNTEERYERASDFYDVSLSGMLESYRRFIDTAKSISNDFIISNQARNLIISEIQSRIVSVFSRVIKYEMFEGFISSFETEDVEESESKMNDIIDFNFVVAEEIRNGIKEEIEFRVTSGHIPSLITTRISSIFLSRFNQVSGDDVLSGDQQDSLNDMTQNLHDNLIEQVSNTDIDVYTVEIMNGFSDEYLQVVLPEVRNYLIAIFTEFRSVLTRSRLEGTQTCIVQFYEMRRSLDYNFFFTLSEEEGFDLDKTSDRFEVFFSESLSDSKEQMLSLVRMSNILFLYDDSFDFLSSLSEILFFTDEKVRSVIDELTSDFHDQLATSVGESIVHGIDDVFERESSESKEVILAVFDDFRNNMEVQKVQHIVNETRSIISNEISTKVNFVIDVFPDLILSFKTEATSKFDEEWLLETQKQFITETDADFDGMRRFVVEEMNITAESITQSYRDLVGEYIENQIVSIGSSLGAIIETVSQSITDSPVGDVQKDALFESLASAQTDIEGSISSVDASIRVTLEGLIQDAIRSLDQVMDIKTNNFFETTRHVIISQFQEWAQTSLTELYIERIEDITLTQKDLANSARAKFEDHVTKLVNIENEFRDEIEIQTGTILENWSVGIVNDFNIISYNARRGILISDMRNEISTKGLDIRRERSGKLWDLNRAYEEEKGQFENLYNNLASDKMVEFSVKYAAVIEGAYERFSDVLGSIGDVLALLEGDLRSTYTEMYREVVDNVLTTSFNDLPVVDMNTISYSPGIIGLADPFEGNLPSLMLPHLIVEFSAINIEISNGENIDAVTEEGLTQLGETSERKPHERIIFAMSDFDKWEEKTILDAIETVEQNMDQRLKENTCPNKPCEDGSVDCDNPICRNGYILEQNSHGILCCKWAPQEAGFPIGEVGRMVGEELALMLFVSPDGAALMLKMSKLFAKKVGTVASKMTKSLKMLTKFRKLSGPIAKASGKMTKKLALKVGVKAGKKLSIKLGAKFGTKLGLKVGGKIAAELVQAVAEKLLKSSMKIASSGPLGAALLIFDIVSLSLDLFDIGAYNQVQSSGQIKKISDGIMEQYTESLKSEGINDPFISDVMYEIDPEEQGSFIEKIVIEWFSESLISFSSANEARWELMPDSESSGEYEAEIERLSSLLDTDINIIQQLICDNLENTFMVRQSTISNTDKSIIGTTQDKDYEQSTKTHLKQCSLNSVGVELSNAFSIQKTDFINELRKDPLYRWSKIQNGFKVYKDLTESELVTAENEISRREDIINNGGTISDEVLKTASVTKIGYILERVDEEREFWKQHTYMKEVSGTFPERKDYIKAWDYDKEVKQKDYDASIITTMEENLVDLIPCDPFTGICESNVSIEMIKNKTSDSPIWWPTYDELFEQAKEEIDDNIAELLKEEKTSAQLEEVIKQKIAEAQDMQVVEETKNSGDGALTLEQARQKRLERELEAASEVISPDFSVFKNGFGQSSPLISIKNMCDDMGYGVTFDPNIGNCNFTREYCKRYGLTYFFNKDTGGPDCELSGGQRVAETIVGTTITRSVKRLFGTNNRALGAVLTNSKIMGDSIKPYNMANELDRKGLGAKYDIWN